MSVNDKKSELGEQVADASSHTHASQEKYRPGDPWVFKKPSFPHRSSEAFFSVTLGRFTSLQEASKSVCLTF